MRILFVLIVILGAIWVATARPEPLIVRPYGSSGGQTLLHGYLK